MSGYVHRCATLYESCLAYNVRMTAATAKISRNGQFSLPAEIRHRWNAERVIVVDRGDYVIVRPVSGDVLETLRGKYAGPGPASEEMRAADRAANAHREARRR